MQYLIQVICYTGIMLTVYLLLLKDKPMHQLSRSFLLACIILPLLLPFATLPGILQSKMPAVNIIPVQLDEIVIGANTAEYSATWQLSLYIYAGIAFLLVLVQLRDVFRVRSIIRRSAGMRAEHYTLLPNTGYGPGSWGNYIFLPDEVQHKDIIAHEAAHIRLKHTYDLLLLNIVQAICWPNVFLILIRRELVLVHEFQADGAVPANKDEYARLLVSSLFSTCTIPMSHSFIVHPIKRRIMMLYKKTNRSSLLRKSLLVASVTALLTTGIVSLQSCERSPKQPESPAVYSAKDIEKMPEFKGDLGTYLGKSMKYPKEAKENNIEGKVVVEFIIDEQGAVKDPIVKKSPNEALAQEALRVVSTMPNWTPGEKDGKKVKVKFYLPVTFTMKKDNAS